MQHEVSTRTARSLNAHVGAKEEVEKVRRHDGRVHRRARRNVLGFSALEMKKSCNHGNQKGSASEISLLTRSLSLTANSLVW